MKCKISVLKILVLFAPLLFCMRANAQALPVPSAETIEITSLFFADLFKLGFLSGGVFPEDSTISDFADYVQNDFSVADAYSVTFNDITITKAPDGWIDELNNAVGDVYGENGVLSNNDDIYIGHVDNGYFTGDFYCDADGNILSTDSSLGSLLFNAKYGGLSYGHDRWVSFYSDFLDILNEQNLNFSLDEDIDLSDNNLTSYYVAGRYWWDGRGLNKVYSVLYVPNSYDYGKSVAYGNSINNGFANYYFSNDANYSLMTKHWAANGVIDENYSVFNILNSNFLWDGYTYTKRINPSTVLFSEATEYMTLSEFINFSPTYDQYDHYVILQDNGFRYDSNTYDELKNEDIISFVSVGYGDDIYDLNDTYSHTDTGYLIDDIENTESIYNDSFSYSTDITAENPIFVIPDENIDVITSTIPFPNVANPDDTITANPTLVYDPAIQATPEVIVNSFWNFQIPFVQNLFKKYPFSIPWDIKNFFLGFTSQAKAPAWDFDYTITIAGKDYTTHFEGDLSDYEPLAVIFRNLITISFIIFLAVYSYFKHS